MPHNFQEHAARYNRAFDGNHICHKPLLMLSAKRMDSWLPPWYFTAIRIPLHFWIALAALLVRSGLRSARSPFSFAYYIDRGLCRITISRAMSMWVSFMSLTYKWLAKNSSRLEISDWKLPVVSFPLLSFHHHIPQPEILNCKNDTVQQGPTW